MKKFLTIFTSIGVFFAGILRAEEPVQSKPLVVILMGPPGAGKGTHAVELSKKLGLSHISTGDLFRENIQKGTPLGLKAKEFIEKGQLVPDSLVLDMVFDRTSRSDCVKGYILDGFPRTIAQAEALNHRLENSTRQIAINLQIADNLLVERIVNRLVCKKCGAPHHKIFLPPKVAGVCDQCSGELHQRKDDTEAVVKERLNVYRKETQPLIQFYSDKNVLFHVNSVGKKETVFSQLLETIQKASR
ncbi:MAG: adenylate kinase [Chlamydiota bacterium]